MQPKNKITPEGRRLKIVLIFVGFAAAILIAGFAVWQIWFRAPGTEPQQTNESPSFIPETNTAYGVQMSDRCYYEFQNFINNHGADYSGCMQDVNLDEDYCSGFDPDTQALSDINVMVILDASGSMASQVDSDTKMNVAKKAVAQFLTQVPAGVNTGLVVYGHKGSNAAADKEISCSGIDEIIKLGANNSGNIISAMNSFNPRGWTPIAGSLNFARKLFVERGNRDENYLILVSDGIESCDGDALDAARELKSEVNHIELNVIGFADDNATKNFLQDIAYAAGASYSSAKNTSEIVKRLNDQLVKIKKACINGTVFRINLKNEENNLNNLNCWLEAVKQESENFSTGIQSKSIGQECAEKISQALDVRQKEFWEAKDAIVRKNEAIFNEKKAEADAQLQALDAR